MAKKKKDTFEFEYRRHPQWVKTSAHKVWLQCTSEAKDKMERMFPNVYIFKRKTPPEPTPSMVKKTKGAEENDK